MCKRYPSGPTFSPGPPFHLHHRKLRPNSFITHSRSNRDRPPVQQNGRPAPNTNTLTDDVTQHVNLHVLVNEAPELVSPMTESEDFMESDNIGPLLKSTIQELRVSNRTLTMMANRQQGLIESLSTQVSNCMSRINELEFEVDDLRQERLSDRVIISGPVARDFISSTSEFKDGMRQIGFHSLNN